MRQEEDLKFFNHFGIKCHEGWTGESVEHDDDSSQECFRKYYEPAESFNDRHALF
jgi:flagellum-specific peptidoglycan hydrolase FlgJ